MAITKLKDLSVFLEAKNPFKQMEGSFIPAIPADEIIICNTPKPTSEIYALVEDFMFQDGDPLEIRGKIIWSGNFIIPNPEDILVEFDFESEFTDEFDVIKYAQMDEDFPHICFHCGNPLIFFHALKNAIESKFTIEKFQEIWESKHVEFLCCKCYKELV